MIGLLAGRIWRSVGAGLDYIKHALPKCFGYYNFAPAHFSGSPGILQRIMKKARDGLILITPMLQDEARHA